jgi:plastocyanin
VPALVREIEMRFQIAAAALAIAALLAAPASARPEDLTLPLAVRDSGFEPAQIEAPAGARVRIEITNQTGAAIEFESFELNRERVVQPGQKVAVYVSDLSAGRYEFFDDFKQARRGVLLVK